jgi:two-component system chemotaxis response regulator CheB
MPVRDIIVVGASLGGVDALQRLASHLPGDLKATVLVVLHVPPNAPSLLPELLSAAGPLRAMPARDGQELTPGHIFTAVPDRHLIIEGDRMRLSRGPRENHSRPAVDVLFRSAALYGGRRVIGVVLTGLLDDGTAGLWAVKERGGVAIVQSPEEAAYPSMPSSALRHVQVDYTLKLHEMGEKLGALTKEAVGEHEGRGMSNRNIEIETSIALEDNALERGVRSLGVPSFYTCPDCHGSMVAIEEGSLRRFRCHTGHAYSTNALSYHSLMQSEKNLWTTLALLEEHEALLREAEQRAREHSSEEVARECAVRAEETRRLRLQIRQLAMSPFFSIVRGPAED